jgi:hypothetical protein
MKASKSSLLLKKCSEFEQKIISLAYPDRITMFHGTDAKKLQLILSDAKENSGLMAFKPSDNIKGVYLTPDMQTAARYAVNHHSNKHEYPVVLEIQLSSKKRVKKLLRDTMDRSETAYEQEVSQETESLRYLENDIAEVFGKEYFAPSGFDRYFDTRIQDLTELKGKNVYKAIIQYGIDNGFDKNELKKMIFKVMPPGTDYDGLMEIANDGTITLTESYYRSAHQLIYPNNLPSATIKSIYISNIPEEIAKSATGSVSLKQKMLPHEIKGLKDELTRCIGKYVWKNPSEDDAHEVMEKAIENLKDIDIIGLYSDAWLDLEKILQNGDWESFKELLLGIEDDINRSYGDDEEIEAGKFYKFTLEQAKNIVNSLV